MGLVLCVCDAHKLHLGSTRMTTDEFIDWTAGQLGTEVAWMTPEMVEQLTV